jgi:Bacterial Ig-like domain (group 2)
VAGGQSLKNKTWASKSVTLRLKRGEMKIKLSFVSALLILLAAVFATGCGSSGTGGSGDFVFTGNNGGNQAPGQGAVTFNFMKAQNPLTVPDNTTTIDFHFYSGADGNGTVVQTESRAFAPTITISPVTTLAKSIVVTARSADGYPLVESTVAVEVIPNEEVVVNFTAANTAEVTINSFFLTPPSADVAAGGTLQITASLRFSNGEVLPANNVTWGATGQASVNASGLVTALNDGTATVTATRDGATSQSILTIGTGQVLTTITVTPPNPTVGLGSQIPFTATAVDQNGDPFILTDLVWSATAGTGDGDINPTTGLFDATAIGDVTVTATQNSVPGNSVVTILDNVPAVTLDMGTLGLNTSSGDVPFAPNAVVTDDQANLSGGTLRVNLGTGTITNAIFTAPVNPVIGVISGDGSNNLSVALNANSTPANIQLFLQTLTINAGMVSGNGTIRVNLSDGQGNNAMQATRAFSVSDPTPGSLTTTFAGGNGCDGGSMFDVTTAGNPVRIDSFDIHFGDTTMHSVEVFYKVGTFSGSETTPGDWSSLGSTTVTGAGLGNPTPLAIGGLTIPASSTYAIYVATTGIKYTNGGTAYMDAAITITNGVGLCGNFSGTNNPREWNGTIYYTVNP